MILQHQFIGDRFEVSPEFQGEFADELAGEPGDPAGQFVEVQPVAAGVAEGIVVAVLVQQVAHTTQFLNPTVVGSHLGQVDERVDVAVDQSPEEWRDVAAPRGSVVPTQPCVLERLGDAGVVGTQLGGHPHPPSGIRPADAGAVGQPRARQVSGVGNGVASGVQVGQQLGLAHIDAVTQGGQLDHLGHRRGQRRRMVGISPRTVGRGAIALSRFRLIEHVSQYEGGL